MNVGEKLGAAVPTVSGEDEGWVVERTPNGVWIHGPSPTPGSFAPPRMIFLPDTVFAALVAAAEERGAAAERERNTYRDQSGEVLYCPRCGASDPEGYTRKVLDS